ncbi:ELL-associated factor 1 [Tupaia chinensis]|uniref:ELL-associated factor 1 n=1 Tax=Tupaia chinensis TaxID=246437 RepID=L9KLV6_TUPCH|nr:ELL-associated factor 1 [Tupaia chinensis]
MCAPTLALKAERIVWPSQPPPPPPPMPFRALAQPPTVPKTSLLKDNPSPEPQLDDIERKLGSQVDLIGQISSSSGSSSSNSESSSGSDHDSSSSWDWTMSVQHLFPSCHTSSPTTACFPFGNGTSWPQGSNQLMTTLRNDLQLSESDIDRDD